MVLVPARTTFASRMAYLFYFSIPLFPFADQEESHCMWSKDKVSYSYYIFCSLRQKEATISTLADMQYKVAVK